MSFRVPLRRKRKVVLIRSPLHSSPALNRSPTTGNSKSEELRRLSLEGEEMADTPVDEELATSVELPRVPPLFSEYPPIRDALETDSSKVQNETIEECLPFLTEPELDLNSFGIPQLRRKQHTAFLIHALEHKYPPHFVSIDASRPWIPYWALTGLSLLGEDVSQYGRR
jgi:hypothetical protein